MNNLKKYFVFLLCLGGLFTTRLAAQMNAQSEPALRDYCQNYTAKQFFALPAAKAPIDPRRIDYPLLVAAIFHETNVQRSKRNIPELTFSVELCRAGATHLADMKANRYFDHENPKRKKETQLDVRLSKFIKGLNGMGENIAMNWVDNSMNCSEIARAVLQLWLDSPGHRRNLLDRSFQLLGTGMLSINIDDDFELVQFNYIQCFGSK
jgi:uncharacterized protein YkwD